MFATAESVRRQFFFCLFLFSFSSFNFHVQKIDENKTSKNHRVKQAIYTAESSQSYLPVESSQYERFFSYVDIFSES